MGLPHQSLAGAQRSLGRLDGRYVLDHRDEILGHIRAPSNNGHGEVGPDQLAVFAHVALFNGIAVPFPAQDLLQHGFVGADVVRMGEILEAHLHKFFRCVTHHLTEGLVYHRQATLKIDLRDAGGGEFEGVTEPLAAGLQFPVQSSQPLVLPLHPPDGTDHHHLGQQVPQVQPEGFDRVVEGQRSVGRNQHEVHHQHTQQCAEDASGEAAVQRRQRGRERQGDEPATGLGRRKSDPDAGCQQGQRDRHRQPQPQAVLGRMPVPKAPPQGGAFVSGGRG